MAINGTIIKPISTRCLQSHCKGVTLVDNLQESRSIILLNAVKAMFVTANKNFDIVAIINGEGTR
jgi:hypothetical protein